ncbi:hypothetical protein Dimus_037159 [Dionaea muscipula]
MHHGTAVEEHVWELVYLLGAEERRNSLGKEISTSLSLNPFGVLPVFNVVLQPLEPESGFNGLATAMGHFGFGDKIKTINIIVTCIEDNMINLVPADLGI